jgi:hypothetical protein
MVVPKIGVSGSTPVSLLKLTYVISNGSTAGRQIHRVTETPLLFNCPDPIIGVRGSCTPQRMPISTRLSQPNFQPITLKASNTPHALLLTTIEINLIVSINIPPVNINLIIPKGFFLLTSNEKHPIRIHNKLDICH